MYGPIIKRKQLAVKATKSIAKVVLSPFFRIKVSGSENIPEEGAFVLLVKHQRWEDIPLLGISVKRQLYYIAKSELFINPVLGWYISSIGGIPLDRKKPSKSRNSMELMIDLLRIDEGIVIFPEGTYYNRCMGPIHLGVIKMILSRLPAAFIPEGIDSIPVDIYFIPVGIEYAQRIWRRPVEIRIGKPIMGKGVSDLKGIADYSLKEISRLSGQENISERE